MRFLWIAIFVLALEASVAQNAQANTAIRGDPSLVRYAGFNQPGRSLQAAKVATQSDNDTTASATTAQHHDCSNDSSGLSLAVLKVEASWESHGYRDATDITLVTQMSSSKQNNLVELCAVWSGVISVAVYVPLLHGKLVSGGTTAASVADTISRLAEFHKLMDTQGPCKLDMTLYSEDVASDVMAAFYPVNSLRNRALAQAKTEVVLLSDVDFMVDFGLSDPRCYEAIQQATRHHGAVVLPAFEPAEAQGITQGRETALTTTRLDNAKPQAVKLYREGQLVPFHLARWDLAHRATNYSRWADSATFYDIEHEKDFEPYVMAGREGLPQYDERFRGYFENKAVHIQHMARLGYSFVVHPTAFVIHLPHEQSAARLMLIDKANEALRSKVQTLGTAVREWIDSGSYSPVTTESCTPDQLAAMITRS